MTAIHSLTKRRLERGQIQELLHTALGPAAELDELVEFDDGWFSAVYGLVLADGQRLVLKVAPDPGLVLLRYEVELMRTEIDFFRRAARSGIPVPTVRYADPDGGYLLMDWLTGRNLAELSDGLDPEQQYALRHRLGRLCAGLHTVTGPLFGYPRRDGHTRSASWRTSFLTIIEDILADAVTYDRQLPAPAGEIRAVIERHAGLLDEVRTPALVHFDLWDGNIFVVPDTGGYAVEAFIDGERSFYGDPLAEFASVPVFGEPEQVPGLLAGYFGTEREFTPAERTRLRMYRLYLDLILLTEGAVRGYDPQTAEPLIKLAMEHGGRELAALAGPTGA